MPLRKYGVLAGKAIAARREDNETRLTISRGARVRNALSIAVNVRSNQHPPISSI
jgi:hypothetical protein